MKYRSYFESVGPDLSSSATAYPVHTRSSLRPNFATRSIMTLRSVIFLAGMVEEL